MSSRVASDEGIVAALPFAAAATLLAARLLPIDFEFHENSLGIVSYATRQHYPHQQEMFWLLFALASGTLLTWLAARLFRGERVPLPSLIACEALGATALLAALWLPTLAAFPVVLVAAVCALRLALRRRANDIAGDPVEAPPPAGPVRSRIGSIVFAGAIVLLAIALVPNFWLNVWNVTHGIADERRAAASFTFMGEIGQHLAWADALWRGGFHGKDFFCLYGPLYDLGAVGIWALLGRSIAAWDLYFSLTRVLAMTGLLLLGAALLRRRVWVTAVPFLVPWINLRVGLALFGLLLLDAWLRGGRARWAGVAGAVGGASLLYSQEFGLAFLVAAAVPLALRREPRAAAAFAAGLALVVAPVFAWYAANDALAPMLRDVVAYPGYMLAGFGKIPFPSFSAPLPTDPSSWRTPPVLELRIGYAIPAVCVAALLLALRVSRIDPRRPLASLAGVLGSLREDPRRLLLLSAAVFGLLSFRVALGRSDIFHMMQALPAAALLLVVVADRLVDRWRVAREARPLVAWRVVALVVFLLHAGFGVAPDPVGKLRESAVNVSALLDRGNRPVGSRAVMRVTRWIQLRTQPDDPVLFLPNNAAYYYLTGRRNPIRFAMGHQIVTEAHRVEALEDLRRDPPRFVVWDHEGVRVDGLADELVFGEALLSWIRERYEREVRIGAVEILRPRVAAGRER